MMYRGFAYDKKGELVLGPWKPFFEAVSLDPFWRKEGSSIWGEEKLPGGVISWEASEWIEVNGRWDFWPTVGGVLPAYAVARPWDEPCDSCRN